MGQNHTQLTRIPSIYHNSCVFRIAAALPPGSSPSSSPSSSQSSSPSVYYWNPRKNAHLKNQTKKNQFCIFFVMICPNGALTGKTSIFVVPVTKSPRFNVQMYWPNLKINRKAGISVDVCFPPECLLPWNQWRVRSQTHWHGHISCIFTETNITKLFSLFMWFDFWINIDGVATPPPKSKHMPCNCTWPHGPTPSEWQQRSKYKPTPLDAHRNPQPPTVLCGQQEFSFFRKSLFRNQPPSSIRKIIQTREYFICQFIFTQRIKPFFLVTIRLGHRALVAKGPAKWVHIPGLWKMANIFEFTAPRTLGGMSQASHTITILASPDNHSGRCHIDGNFMS